MTTIEQILLHLLTDSEPDFGQFSHNDYHLGKRIKVYKEDKTLNQLLQLYRNEISLKRKEPDSEIRQPKSDKQAG